MPSFTIPIVVDFAGKVKQTITGGSYYTTTSRLILKKNDTATLAVQFIPAYTTIPFLLTAGATVQVALKEKGKFGAGLSYAAFGITTSTPATSNDPYLVSLPVTGEVIDTLFGTAPAEEPYIDLMFEVSWSEDGGSTFNSTSDPIEARVYNDVIRSGAATPALASSLNIPQVYRDNGVIAAVGGSLAKKYDLAAIFNLKAGDTAQFKIQAGAYIRAAYASATPTVTNYSSTVCQYVTTDFSSPFNYDTTGDLPLVPPTFWDEPIGTAEQKWGTVATVFTGGGLVTPNATFKQAGAITATFTHTASVGTEADAQADIDNVQCFVQIELLSVINSVID